MPKPALNVLQSRAWQVSLGRLLLLFAIAVVVGLVIGRLTLTLLLMFAGYSLWSLYSLLRVQRWLLARTRLPPPSDMGVWSDVAEFIYRRHQASRHRQRRLVRLLRAYREAAAVLPDGVVVLSAMRQIVWFNESAGRLLGLDGLRHRGVIIDRLMRNGQILAWLSQARANDPLIDVPSPLHPDIRMSMRLIPYAQGQWLLVVRDVSMLLKLEQVRRDFVANVSHELRTPLTVLHGYLDLIDAEHDPELDGMVREMRKQSARMAQIVEDLLTLSRLDAQADTQDEPISMSSMLAGLRRDAEALSQQQHDIRIEATSTRDLRGSAKDLHSAFANLVANAVRYTPPGGRIVLRWQDVEDGARFSVEDSGFGIPAEHLPRVTERFYRVSTSRSRDKGGTGLGLSIVKHVLGLHQARLDIQSEVGVGSIFSAHFPRERLIDAIVHESA
ncbi:MAG TPA: phosphate regulon sensor histidine kinase PhoR [Patescibacteria group bacterium]|nr:phosphate regulon sensor histidine kinase PhoR [Patescibacteria group bacterium]